MLRCNLVHAIGAVPVPCSYDRATRPRATCPCRTTQATPHCRTSWAAPGRAWPPRAPYCPPWASPAAQRTRSCCSSCAASLIHRPRAAARSPVHSLQPPPPPPLQVVPLLLLLLLLVVPLVPPRWCGWTPAACVRCTATWSARPTCRGTGQRWRYAGPSRSTRSSGCQVSAGGGMGR